MAMARAPRQRSSSPGALIWLETCSCEHCLGRAAVCTAGFNWIDRDDPNHALAHAQEDLLCYFDRLPPVVQNALNQADTNVCSWCAEIWVRQYGAQVAAQLIRDARFVDAVR